MANLRLSGFCETFFADCHNAHSLWCGGVKILKVSPQVGTEAGKILIGIFKNRNRWRRWSRRLFKTFGERGKNINNRSPGSVTINDTRLSVLTTRLISISSGWWWLPSSISLASSSLTQAAPPGHLAPHLWAGCAGHSLAISADPRCTDAVLCHSLRHPRRMTRHPHLVR